MIQCAMSDKRSIDAEEHGNKRQKLDELSESGPLTQRDVVYFQKEAIYRQLVQYKAKVGIMEKEVREYSKNYDQYKSKLIILNGWVDQFVSYLQQLLNKPTDETSDILANGELLNLTEDEFTASLNGKRSLLNQLLSQLTSNLPNDVSKSLNALNKESNELKLSRNDLLSQNELLKTNYKDLNEKYIDILKQSERLNSSTIKRINEIKSNKADSNDDNDKSNIKSEDNSTKDSNNNNSNQIDTLNLEIEQQKSFIKSQESIIKDQLVKLTQLQDELNKSSKNQSMKVNDIKSSIEYQQIFKDYELLKNQHAETSFKYDSLLENYQTLEKSSNQLQDLFNNSFNEEKDKIVKQFEVLEKDLVRIRTARDELLSKVSILESEKSQSSVIVELQDFLKSQSSIIESLNFEILQPKDVIEDNDIESLKKKNSILTQELQSLENAFKSTSSNNLKKFNNLLEIEQNLNKFKIEKQKADQKYFAAMRSKDSLLLQLKNMKDLNKNYELKLSNLQELKNISQEEIDSLTSNLSNSNKLIELKQKEIDQLIKKSTSLELKLKESSSKLDSLQKKVDSLSKEHSKLTASETSLRLANQKLTNQTESLNKQMDRYKSQSSEALNSEELEQYRSLIYCSLCSKNWKNTAITQCGHVFCEACTKERLDARMRKCPTCNKAFSYNDLLTVHL